LFQDLLAPSSAQLDDGRDFAAQAAEVVSALVPRTEAVRDLYEQLLRQMGDAHEGLYQRAQRVAAVAGLIALGVGQCKPEDVVLAALLCDIGTVLLDEDLHTRSYDTSAFRALGEPERKAVSAHVATSLQTLADKKMAILPKVRTAIQQHHEKYDGSGYPGAIKGPKIAREAQILSVALQLDLLTAVRPGQARVTPAGAIKAIAGNGSIGPDLMSELNVMIKPRSEDAA
jgi:HD-GYP domain-containing protein (c-di-GMP phosphodiesterase class II)